MLKRIILIVLLVGVGSYLWLRHQRKNEISPEQTPLPTTALAAQTAPVFSQLQDALHKKQQPALIEAANAVRRQALVDRTFLLTICFTLNDHTQDEIFREVLALILGSLPRSEAQDALLQLMERASHPDLLYWGVISMGCTREEGEKKLFENQEGPWIAHHPAGLDVLVKRKIDDPKVLQCLIGLIASSSSGDVRLGTVMVLRHSLDSARVRDHFIHSLQQPYESATLAELTEALSAWVVQQPTASAEGGRIVEILLSRALESEQEVLRQVLEPLLRQLSLTDAQVQRLMSLTDRSHDPELQLWALNLLAQKLDQWDATRRESILPFLLKILSLSPDPRLREKAATSLSKFPSPVVSGALLQALQADMEGRVRASAMDALENQLLSEDHLEIIRKMAAQDPEESIRKKAAALLSRHPREAGVPQPQAR